MNYKIITDAEKLKQFIAWLPELENGESYYYCLFSRSKYDTKGVLKKNKQQIKRGTSTKEYLFNKIKNLEVEIGSYYQNNVSVPEESLALYITPNPRSYINAAKDSLKKFADLVTSEYNGYNPHQEVLSIIHKSCSRKLYFDLDFDNTTIEEMMPMINERINNDCLTYVQTRGGFHLLIEFKKIEKQYIKNWYNNLTTLPNCDIRGDNLLPVPGCTQGGFTPILLDKI